MKVGDNAPSGLGGDVVLSKLMTEDKPQETDDRRLHDTSSKTILSNDISPKGPFRQMTISSKCHFA